MASKTLLEITQSCMAALDSDEIDNVDDTAESEQVVDIIESIYYQIIENETIPNLEKYFQLDSGSGNTVFQYPSDIYRLDWIKYDKHTDAGGRTQYQDVHFKTQEEFLEFTNARNSTNSNIESLSDPNGSGIVFYIEDNKVPEYWTSIADTYIVMDSYDSSIDASGLVTTKTQCFGQRIPTFTRSNSFTPAMHPTLFPFFIAECKSTVVAILKQEVNQKLEQHSKRAAAKVQNDRYRNNRSQYNNIPDFGRK